MDALDRLYRRLVQNIRTTRPEYLNMPFTVQELYEQLVPYRHNRRELAIESNQDYETAVARLLSGERNYLTSDTVVREAVKHELASPTGDHGVFKEYAHATVSLVRDTGEIAATSSTPTTAVPTTKTSAPSNTPPATAKPMTGSATIPAAVPSVEQLSASSSTTVAYDLTTPSTSEPSATPPPMPALLSSLANITVPTSCRFCSGTLPEGRDVNYCPHCGENLKVQRCPACGGEMDNTWKFCVMCGRRAL